MVSIGAFEHFGFGKYDDYFKKTFNLMPDDGVMLLHTIIIPSDEEVKAKKLPLTMSTVRFIKFILDEIYPGGRLPLAAQVDGARHQGRVHRHPRTAPAAALRAHAGHLGGKSRVQQGRGHRDHLRSRSTSGSMKYLTGCADLFRNGYTDVCQFTCEKG